MSPRLVILALLACAASSLAGCGKMSELERPRPMFGTPSDSAPVTEGRQQAAARARADAARSGTDPAADAPQSIDELRNYNPAARPKGDRDQTQTQTQAPDLDPQTQPPATPQ